MQICVPTLKNIINKNNLNGFLYDTVNYVYKFIIDFQNKVHRMNKQI